jgi:hypothetical protein
MRTTILAISASLLLAPSLAHADDDETALVIDATMLAPRKGVHAGATGMGAELRFFPDDECVTGSIGGFAAVGEQGAPTRQDVLDVHFQIGMKPEHAKRLVPYASLGIDVLHVTTHEMEESFRGTTLGVSAQAGLLGKLSDKWIYRVSAGYLGAIVPGTGDDLGSVVLQLGIGYMIDD